MLDNKNYNMDERFDYFYGNEDEQYLHFQLPVMLFRDERFKHLSDGSKILYSMLLNRTSLSIKNNWKDKQGRTYIIYTVEEMMEDLSCWEKKINRAMKELTKVGLIKSVRQGQGKPNLTYVMNFETVLKYQLRGKEDNSRLVKRTNQELSKGQSIYNNNNYTNNSYSNLILSNQEEEKEEKTDKIRFDKKLQELAKKVMLKRENKPLSQSTQNAVEAVAVFEVQKELATTIHENHTFVEPVVEAITATYEPTTTPVAVPVATTVTTAPVIAPAQSLEQPVVRYQHAQVETIIKKNIEYNLLLQDNITSQKTLNEIVSSITNTICTDYRGGYIYMGDERVPSEVVKSKFFKLDSEHIKYFVDCYNRLTKKVIKLPEYIRKSLYKNCDTIEHYYTNLVNHDMNQRAVQSMENNTPATTTNQTTMNKSNPKNKFNNFPQREHSQEYFDDLETHLLQRIHNTNHNAVPSLDPESEQKYKDMEKLLFGRG